MKCNDLDATICVSMRCASIPDNYEPCNQVILGVRGEC